MKRQPDEVFAEPSAQKTTDHAAPIPGVVDDEVNRNCIGGGRTAEHVPLCNMQPPGVSSCMLQLMRSGTGSGRDARACSAEWLGTCRRSKP